MATDRGHFGRFMGFSDFPPFEIVKIKVVLMISNFERFQQIQKQADSESYSSLCHVEPRNLPRSPYMGIPNLHQNKSEVSNIESENSQNVRLEDYNNISDGIIPHITTPSIKISLG